MADITSTIRGLWSKGMESIGNAANSVADSAHNKADEIQLENRRRDIMNGFAAVAYEQFKQGAKFPPECEKMFLEVAALDEQLTSLRQNPTKAAKAEKQEKSVPSLHVPETPTQLVPGHLVKGLGPVPSMNVAPASAAPSIRMPAEPVAVIESADDELEAAAAKNEELPADETGESVFVEAEPVQEAVLAAVESAVPAAASAVEMIFTSSEEDEPAKDQ